MLAVHLCFFPAPPRGSCHDAESFLEMQQLRYCLCTVCRAVCSALAGVPNQGFSHSLRRTFFDTFGSWCEEGCLPARYRAEVAKAANISRMRIKDPDSARQNEGDMAEASDVVEHAAYLGMAAMLLVNSMLCLHCVWSACGTLGACTCWVVWTEPSCTLPVSAQKDVVQSWQEAIAHFQWAQAKFESLLA